MTISSSSGACDTERTAVSDTDEEDRERVVADDTTATTSTGDQRTQQPITTSEIDISETEGVRLGKCKWFNVAKGWGFIQPNDGGHDVFVHQSAIQMPGFRSLGEQEDVEFECKITERGLEATRVTAPGGVECRGSSFRPKAKKRFRRIRCYNCGAFANHIAAKCSLGPQPKRCHFCKSDDHLVADCPNKKAESQTHTTTESTSDQEGDDLSADN